ncbi:hypothetical protein GYMLUDRAFT_78060 [Collybiopsis luxurians FD-317 M1]|uniref:Uncharacterized protein n=1 Tax=Collybiopsis luxurians FD-317 M1 TaxID=944289 RepID=A0A0D0BQC7_9AGAR|nr:hypothetical protein GYMLUDRAFT_78060 [Collybiopsis luxurians FD-317 M1]
MLRLAITCSVVTRSSTGCSLLSFSRLLIMKSSELRTARDALVILKQVDTASTKNVFFELPNSDPYSAVSFDNLHFKYGGLWADLIFAQCKINVHHFSDGIFKLSFNDGSKHCTISKIFLFAACNAHREDNDKAGYQLLKVIHAYLNVDMYSELHNQTSQTISAGCSAVQEMFVAIQKYKSLDHDLEKQWNFIKLHYHTHLFDDIEQNGILKRMNIGDQITQIEHQSVVAGSIQGQIDILDDYENPASNQEPADIEEHVHFKNPIKNHHFSLGSKNQMLSLNDLIHSETQVATDQLCYNPSFNGAPCYDFIIFDSVDGAVFAQLCFLFTCTVGSKICPIAFVQPYKPVSLTHWTKLDKDLGLLHFWKEQKTEFISVHSIVHGAVAIPVLDSSREVFIWDVLDGDIFCIL